MSASSEPDRSQAFDRATLLDQLGGDTATLRELLLLYAEEGPRLSATLHAAATAADGNALRRAAHALKGTLGSLSAHRASAAAEAIEVLGRSGQWERVPSALAELDAELQRLDAALKACLAGSPRP